LLSEKLTRTSADAGSDAGLPSNAAPSYRYPFDDVPGDPLLPPVVEPGRALVGVAREILDILDRDALVEKIRDRRRPKAVTAEVLGEPHVLEPPLHHPKDVFPGHTAVREAFRLLLGGPEEGRGFVLGLDSGRLHVGPKVPLKVVADRDFPGFSTFLAEL